jgi:hypothetical protein
MRTSTELLPGLAVTTLGAVLTMIAGGPSGDDRPPEPSASMSACQVVTGSFHDEGFGAWSCTYPTDAGGSEAALAAACGTIPTAYAVDERDAGTVLGFYCPPPLAS